MDTNNSALFQTQRLLAFSASTLYAAFADPTLLAKWWGPKDFSNTFSQFEFVQGGKWVFDMHAPDGTSYHNENVFIELVEAQKVVISHVVEPLFTLSITLQPQPNGTMLVWQQQLDDPEVAAQIAHIIQPSNEQNLDRLEALLAMVN